MTNAKSQATSKRRTAATRFVAALAVAATAGSALVGSQIVAPQAAYAAQEPAATGIDVGMVDAVMGEGHTRETPTGANLNDNIRYGVVTGMSDNRLRTGNTPLGTWLGGETAKNKDAWTYIARGWPWKWDDQSGNTGPGDSASSKKWMQQHYNQWIADSKKIWVDGQSAIGFKPNNPGTVQPGETFLLGAIRHNNLPIRQATQGALGQPYLVSSLNLRFTDLIPGDTGESFPFINRETFNTLSSTIIYRKGGAYIKHPGIAGTGTCRTDIGINGKDATERALPASGVQFLRDAIMDQGIYYGTPKWVTDPATGQQVFIGTAYEPELANSADPSQGYVNKPESRSGRYYCVKYVGEGNGDYDLYSQYYNKGATQPFSDVTAKRVTPINWPGAKGNVNENPYVDDSVQLQKTASDRTFTKNGRTYRLHLWGFVPANNPKTLITPDNYKNIPTANCPVNPPTDALRTDTFITQELSVNYACLYGVITEERTVRIAKSVEDPSGVTPAIPAASFGVTTGANWLDSTGRTPETTGTVSVTKPTPSSAPVKGWFISSSDSATLTPTAFGEANAKYDSHFIPFEVGNSDFTISENQIADPQWKLKDIKCVNGIGEDVAVTKTERGVNFKNVGGAKTDAAAPITCTFVNEYEAPKVPKLRVQKSIENNGGLTGATEFDVDYKIVATNDGNLKTSTGILTDKPEFAKGLEIQSAKVATTQAGLAGAANATAANGTYTLTNGVEVEPGKTAEFWIRFHVKFNSAAAGYDETALECKLDANGIPTAGFGLFNQVNAQTGKDHDGIDNNKACGPYVPAKVRVEKSIEANGGATGAAEFDVDYKIVATNDGQIATTTGKLTDKPEFAKGLEIQSAKIATTQAGLAGAANATAANGVYTLTNGVTLQPGTTAEFWIRFHVKRNTAASGYSETNLACHLDQKNLPVPGFGLFNQVYAENGKDHDGIDNNKACGPNVPHEIVVVKAGTQNTGKTFTDPTNQYTSGDGSALYPLSGAEFAIYSGGNPQNSTSATLVKTLSAGTTTDVYYWSVTGLELNTDYWLVETKAPAGHSLLPRPIPFRLTTDGNGTVVTLGAEVRDQTKWANSAVQAYASVTNATLPQSDQGFVVGGARKATILVKDTEVGHLPVSGSLGIYPYIGVAMALMGGAMVISLVTMKQRRKAENFA